jgi:hypothetical protein
LKLLLTAKLLLLLVKPKNNPYFPAYISQDSATGYQKKYMERAGWDSCLGKRLRINLENHPSSPYFLLKKFLHAKRFVGAI